MIIDRTHRTWIVSSCVVFIATTVWYAVYAIGSSDGPSGGSPTGLT